MAPRSSETSLSGTPDQAGGSIGSEPPSRSSSYTSSRSSLSYRLPPHYWPPSTSPETRQRHAEEDRLAGERLINRLRRELSGVVAMEVPTTPLLDAYFPDPEAISSRVSGIAMANDRIRETLRQLPHWEAWEACDPFVALLNDLTDVALHLLPADNERYCPGLHFVVQDSSLYNANGDERGLSFVAYSSQDDSNTKNISLFGTVHRFLETMTSQSAFYLREMLHTSSRRFGVSLMLKAEVGECHVSILRHGSLWVSEGIPLREPRGFLDLTSIIVGVLSWRDGWTAGFDPTRTDNCIAFPGGVEYEIEHPLCRCDPIRGGGTLVHLGALVRPKRSARKRKLEDIDLQEGPATPRRKSTRLAKASLAPVAATSPLNVHPSDETSLLAGPSINKPLWPECVVIKDSFIKEGRPDDFRVFGAIGEQFGIARVLAAVEVGGEEKRAPCIGGVERPLHIRTITATVGVSLLCADTPRLFLRAVAHAIIGASKSSTPHRNPPLTLSQVIGTC